MCIVGRDVTPKIESKHLPHPDSEKRQRMRVVKSVHLMKGRDLVTYIHIPNLKLTTRCVFAWLLHHSHFWKVKRGATLCGTKTSTCSSYRAIIFRTKKEKTFKAVLSVLHIEEGKRLLLGYLRDTTCKQVHCLV